METIMIVVISLFWIALFTGTVFICLKSESKPESVFSENTLNIMLLCLLLFVIYTFLGIL